MAWLEGIAEAIRYIEDHITEEFTIEMVAKQAYLSPYYFQKGFSMLCGMTIGEYIRQRRLTLAGSELVSTDHKIIDLAVKYGYDSPDSFTRAFVRFHGVTPTAVRKDKATIRAFAAMRIKFTLEGGIVMEYKIVEKEAFTVMGAVRHFSYETAKAEIPGFWEEHYRTGKGSVVCGWYGVCIDDEGGADEFAYLIADNYMPVQEIPAGYETRTIPKHTWAVFPCRGPMPNTLQGVNNQIYSDWLPNSTDYEIAAGYNIEYYSDPKDLPEGTKDENYYTEIWIPVRKKLN